MLEISWLGLREQFSVLPALPSGLLVPLSSFLPHERKSLFVAVASWQ